MRVWDVCLCDMDDDRGGGGLVWRPIETNMQNNDTHNDTDDTAGQPRRGNSSPASAAALITTPLTRRGRQALLQLLLWPRRACAGGCGGRRRRRRGRRQGRGMCCRWVGSVLLGVELGCVAVRVLGLAPNHAGSTVPYPIPPN